MEDRPYDHGVKSGNEGDVVKHVALLAALDALLATWSGGFFRYADTFAGYAQNVLGEGGAWRDGVGRLAEEARLGANPHTALWKRWYLPRPLVRGGAYPGSCLIAADVARHREVPVHLALWDVSEAVVANLRGTWGERAVVFARPAVAGEPEVESAHFLFVDPPDLESWTVIRPTLEPRRVGGSLVWLPVLRGADEATEAARREDATALGYSSLAVGWSATTGRTIGCRLLYRLPAPAERALERAARHVADVAGWTIE